MKFEEKYKEGCFIKELNRRFLCKVLIDGVVKECYVASSTKLNQYLKMENKKVYLTENKGISKRTSYSLFAVEYYNKPIILNLSYANKLVEDYLQSRKNAYNYHLTILREKVIDGYKADFVVKGKHTEVIEVKSVLGSRKSVKFPNVYSERMIDQLQKILILLKSNIKVSYYIVSLSATIKEVTFNSEYNEFNNLFADCINSGMIVKGFCINYSAGEFYIYPRLLIKRG